MSLDSGTTKRVFREEKVSDPRRGEEVSIPTRPLGSCFNSQHRSLTETSSPFAWYSRKGASACDTIRCELLLGEGWRVSSTTSQQSTSQQKCLKGIQNHFNAILISERGIQNFLNSSHLMIRTNPVFHIVDLVTAFFLNRNKQSRSLNV